MEIKKNTHFLYFCNGKAECKDSDYCAFNGGPNAECDRTTFIEYALNKEKYKKQIVDGIFPVESDWRPIGENYAEKLGKNG